MYKIEFTRNFEKSLKKLTREQQKMLYTKLKVFQNNPFHPSLRTKKIQGLENIFEFSVNMDIRVIWKYKNENIVITIDVGHHDILKNF